MKAQRILGSPPFVMLGMAIARTMPTRLAYWVSQRIAQNMSRRRNHLFSTLRANLAHVVTGASDLELDAMAERALYHAGCTYYDMFRLSVKDYQRGRVEVRIDPNEWAITREAIEDDRGTILVGPHISNFDLAAQWIAARGIEMQALSLADPDNGSRVVNYIRNHRGIIMTPIDMPSLRLAMKRLREGGLVLTGVDRSISENDEPILFFDAPARLPTGHIRLALQTNSRVIIACCIQDPDGVYSIRLSQPMEMEGTGSRADDIRHNARRVLAFIEDLIREAPDQWLMFLPVWRAEDA